MINASRNSSLVHNMSRVTNMHTNFMNKFSKILLNTLEFFSINMLLVQSETKNSTFCLFRTDFFNTLYAFFYVYTPYKKRHFKIQVEIIRFVDRYFCIISYLICYHKFYLHILFDIVYFLLIDYEMNYITTFPSTS